jgi:hypothetical protein
VNIKQALRLEPAADPWLSRKPNLLCRTENETCVRPTYKLVGRCSSLHRFWPLTLAERAVCGPQNEGRGRRHLSSPLSPPSFPSSKLLVSDSLRGSNSDISEAKTAGAGYTDVSEKPFSSAKEPTLRRNSEEGHRHPHGCEDPRT